MMRKRTRGCWIGEIICVGMGHMVRGSSRAGMRGKKGAPGKRATPETRLGGSSWGIRVEIIIMYVRLWMS